MEERSREKLVRSCGDVFVRLAGGISEIVAELDSNNDAAEERPPVCHTSSAAICVLSLRVFRSSIIASSAPFRVQRPSGLTSTLHRAYGQEPKLRNVTDNTKVLEKAMSFEDV